MKVKVMSGILIFSLALNLAVIGTFVFKRIVGTDAGFHPRNGGMGRGAFFREMDLDDAKREKIIELFKEFRKINKETQEQIMVLKEQLFETLQGDSSDINKSYSIMDKIGNERLALGKSALNQFLKAKSFLSPEQQNHFYRMLMKNKPNKRLRKPAEEIFKDREMRMKNRQGKKNRNAN